MILNDKNLNMDLIMIPGDIISQFQIMGMSISKTSEDHLENQSSNSLGSPLFLQNKWKNNNNKTVPKLWK